MAGSQDIPCPKCGGSRGKMENVEFDVQDKDGNWKKEKGTKWTECTSCRGSGRYEGR